MVMSCWSVGRKIAFSSSAMVRKIITTRPAKVSLNYHPETYDRALDCANNYGMCGIDELLDLSEELDEYLGCYVDNGPEACEQEIDERHGLSEALLVQGEIREHQRYVQEGNVFNFDVNNGNDSNPGTSGWGQDDEFFWGGGNSSVRP